jgi:GNAT superfamily N-acetyltransferase
MNAKLLVRPVTPQDVTAWRPLWDGYNAHYGRSGPTALAEEVTQATWSRFHDPDEPMHALVAESAGQLLGLVHYLFHRSTTQVALTCYLEDLFTSAESRGKGVGRALINAVYKNARAAGSPNVYWLTHETNTVAMRLYDVIAVRSPFVVYSKTV